MRRTYCITAMLLCAACFMVACGEEDFRDSAGKADTPGNEEHEECDSSFVKEGDSWLATFEEGRIWRFAVCSLYPYGEVTGYVSFMDKGVATVGGKACHAIETTDDIDSCERKMVWMREADGKIYRYDAGGEEELLVFDCNLQVGEQSPQGYTLSAIETKSGCDSIVRRHFLFEECGDILAEYIEGIGYTDSELFAPIRYTSSFQRLISCRDADGNNLYRE